MHIGLIGGIGPAATDLYYRGLITRLKAAQTPFDITIVHADAATLVRNFEARDPEAQVPIYLSLTQRLRAAGAEAVAITSIGGHFCIDAFRPVSPLPILELGDQLNTALTGRGLRRIGLLATDIVMETRVYGGLPDLDVLIPPPEALGAVHRAYVDMATEARITQARRTLFFREGQALIDRGAEAILLGGTDFALAFDGQDPGFPVIDATDIHIDAIAAHMIT